MAELRSGTPRHQQVSDWLREEIASGRWSRDDQLPSESQLGEQFSVSRITVRRALQTLESEGLIYRRQGLGSFVGTNRVHQGLIRLTDFSEDMEAAGLAPTSRVLQSEIEPASETVAAALGLAEGVKVLRLDRLRLGNGEPLAYDRTWLPAFYGQLLDGRDLERETIYHILEVDYKIPVIYGRFRIEAINAPADISQELGIPWGRALLMIERTSVTEGDRTVYYQQRYYRSDRVAYDLQLERSPGTNGRGLPLREFEPVFK
ncbi:MAG: GntR family transcriptional regulator [Rhodothermales bacterium]|nr:GntR family transcriptional regulator [Rhodothermales bacterium]MBO6778830.1 GntR family transcriptional regulator [Rhodothermales bacterium]